jgi:hypothetical protein
MFFSRCVSYTKYASILRLSQIVFLAIYIAASIYGIEISIKIFSAWGKQIGNRYFNFLFHIIKIFSNCGGRNVLELIPSTCFYNNTITVFIFMCGYVVCRHIIFFFIPLQKPKQRYVKKTPNTHLNRFLLVLSQNYY